MPHPSPSALAVGLAAALLALAGCRDAPVAAVPDKRDVPTRRLGLVSSLPLYWPLGAGIADIANGGASVPWQRAALEQAFVLEPLDTLSPIPGLGPDAPDTDPLAGLDRLAVIQPRGLSPADNVALDAWVRKGGHLLLVLDPMLTGAYDVPLGDPRRPADTALIPPVVARWGLEVRVEVPENDEGSYGTAALPGGIALPFAQPGLIAILPEGEQNCALAGDGAIMATCRIGEGKVTLLADAAVFEHPEGAGEDGSTLRAVVASALD